MNRKNKNFDRILQSNRIKNGISVEEVKRKCSQQLTMLLKMLHKNKKLFQSNIMKKGEIATPEEVKLNFVCKNIK